jgi:tetratricopeptide (TPR) repeat protein
LPKNWKQKSEKRLHKLHNAELFLLKNLFMSNKHSLSSFEVSSKEDFFLSRFVKNLQLPVFAALLFFLFSCGTKKNNADENKSTDSSSIINPIQQLTEKIKTDSGNASLYFNRSQFYLAEKKFTPAMADVNKAIALDSTNAGYYITQADIFFATVNLTQAIESFKKSITLDKKNIDAHLRLAELYLYLKKHEEAIFEANSALLIDKHRAKGYFIKGFAFAEMGDTSKAISSYQTCIEQEPAYYDAYIQLGIIFSDKRNPLAIQYYTTAIKLSPSSTEALYDRGLFFQETGQIEKAENDYNSILRIDSHHKDAWFNLGYIEVSKRKNYKKAIDYFSSAISADKYYAEAFYNRGYCYEQLGEEVKAREDFIAAITIVPTYDLAIAGMKRLSR